MAPPNQLLRTLSLALSIVSCFITTVSATWSNPLEHFYPDYNEGLQTIIRDSCSEQYDSYLINKHHSSGVSPMLRIFGMGTMTHEVVECMLENMPELAKYKMGAAQIMLGLTPSIVAQLAVRPQDIAILSVVGRRHLLALGLAVGSPAINAYRAQEYSAAIESLRDRSKIRPHVIRRLDPIIIVVEYALAAAAIANIGELTYRLGAQSIFIAMPVIPYAALLWASLGFVIHVFTGFALLLRVSTRLKPRDDVKQGASWPVSLAQSQFDILVRRTRIIFKVHPESLVFSAMSLLTTIFTACHIIFGTLIFSSVLFVAVKDAPSIIARLMASTILCRIVLTFELLVLRESIEEDPDSQRPEAPHVLSFK
jgi:hypothetical protein